MAARWTQKEIEILVRLYPDHEKNEIEKQLGRSEKSIYWKANELNIKKSDSFVSVGKDYKIRFVKRSKSRLDAIFKAGNKPHNYKPIGSVRECADGYIKIKTGEPRKWELMHRIIWEKENNRKIPKGHFVRFKDNNKQNLDIENLELISSKAMMELNTLHRYPPEIKNTIRLLSEVNRKINERHK